MFEFENVSKYGIVVFNGIFIAILLIIKYIKSFSKLDENTLKKNVLFVIAHPDDEAM